MSVIYRLTQYYAGIWQRYFVALSEVQTGYGAGAAFHGFYLFSALLHDIQLRAEKPPRTIYSLTPFGRSIIPVLSAMCDWGTAYLNGLDAPFSTSGQVWIRQ